MSLRTLLAAVLLAVSVSSQSYNGGNSAGYNSGTTGYSGGNGNGNCDACERNGGDKANIQELTFVYNGRGGMVTVVGIGSAAINTGDTLIVNPFSVNVVATGARGMGRGSSAGGNGFPTNTQFFVDGQMVTLHTSCSQPIFVGQNVGSLTISGWETDQGSSVSTCGPNCYERQEDCPPADPYSSSPPPPCILCCYEREEDCPTEPIPPSSSDCDACIPKARPSSLTFRITGGAGFGSIQDGKGSVSGSFILGNAGPYTVQCQNRRNRNGAFAFVSMSIDGNEFTVSNIQENELTCTINGGGGSQSIEIHTSCSAPILIGDVYGALTLTAFINGDTGMMPAACSPSPPPPCVICCELNPPVITTDHCPIDLVLENDGAGNVAEIQAYLDCFRCTDDSDPHPTLSYHPHPLIFTGPPCDRIATVNVSCVDDCENGASVIGTVRIVDTTPPHVTNEPTDVIAECDGTDTPPGLEDWLHDFGGLRASDLVFGHCDSGYYRRDRRQYPTISNNLPLEDASCYCPRTNNDQAVCVNGNTYRTMCFAMCMSTNLNYQTMTYSAGACPSGDRQCDVQHGLMPLSAQMDYQCQHYIALAISTGQAPPHSVLCGCLSQVSGPGPECVFDAFSSSSTIAEYKAECSYVTPSSGPCENVTYSHGEVNFEYAGGYSHCTKVANVAFTASDPCGNNVTRYATFSVSDTLPPIVTDPTSPVVECDMNTAELFEHWLSARGGAKATDACGNVTWTMSPYNPTLPPVCNGQEVVTFIATDECGLSTEVTGTFKVKDTTAPRVIKPPQKLKISGDFDPYRDEIATWLEDHGGMTVSDLCPHSPAGYGMNYGGPQNHNQAETNNSMCYNCLGENAAYFGDQLVCLDGNKQYDNICFMWCHNGYVSDQSRIQMGGCEFDSYVGSSYDGITWSFSFGQIGPCAQDTTCPLCKPVTFVATDACGNKVERRTEVKITDNEPPVIVVPCSDGYTDTDQTLQADLQTWLRSYGGLKVDDYDAVLSYHLVHDFTGSCPEVAKYRFKAADDCGNTVTCDANFYLKDRDDPVITGGHDLEYPCDENCHSYDTYWETDAQEVLNTWLQNYGCLNATDCSNIVWDVRGAPYGYLCGASGTVTFKVTDAYGRTAQKHLSYNFPRVGKPPCNAHICGSGSYNEYTNNKPSIQSLTLKYTGYDNATVTIAGFGTYTVHPGGTINFGLPGYASYKKSMGSSYQSGYQYGNNNGGSYNSGGNSGSSYDTGGYAPAFPSNVVITVNGVTTTLHTSCSSPLSMGQAVGQYLKIVGFKTDQSSSDEVCPKSDSYGPNCNKPAVCGHTYPTRPPTPPPNPAPTPCHPIPVDVCPANDYTSGMGGGVRPHSLLVRYVPGSSISNYQGGRVQVTGSVSGTATVSCEGANVHPPVVEEGGIFTITPSSGFGSNTMCVITGNGQQRISFHTSCSRALRTQDVFGSFVIVGFNGNINNGGCPGPYPPPPAPPGNYEIYNSPTQPYAPPNPPYIPPNEPYVPPTPEYVPPPPPPAYDGICEDRDTLVYSLDLMYTGIVNQDSYHPSQKPVIRIDDYSYNGGNTRVRVRTKKNAIFEGRRSVLKNVRQGDTFTLYGNRNQGAFGKVLALECSGAYVKFVTSCRRQLRVGDVYGPFTILGYSTDPSTSSSALGAIGGASDESGQSSSSLSAGTIVGIVGAFVGVIGAVLAVGIFVKSKNKAAQPTQIAFSHTSSASNIVENEVRSPGHSNII